MLLLVTFGYLILITPGKVLIFYLNFYSGHTAYYYAGTSFIIPGWRKDIVYQPWNKLPFLCNVWSEI